MKTGGGPPPKSEADLTTSKVLGLLGKELEPSNNSYDCDTQSGKCT